MLPPWRGRHRESLRTPCSAERKIARYWRRESREQCQQARRRAATDKQEDAVHPDDLQHRHRVAPKPKNTHDRKIPVLSAREPATRSPQLRDNDCRLMLRIHSSSRKLRAKAQPDRSSGPRRDRTNASYLPRLDWSEQTFGPEDQHQGHDRIDHEEFEFRIKMQSCGTRQANDRFRSGPGIDPMPPITTTANASTITSRHPAEPK